MTIGMTTGITFDMDLLIDFMITHELSAAQEHKARLLLLDTIVCAISSMNDPVVRQVAERLGDVTPGPHRIPGSNITTGVTEATFAMTLAACWFEACEGLASAHGRPGLSVIPAALMIGQAQNIPLGNVLTAIALGYEIGGRLGAAYRIKDGMHVDGTWGMAASAASVAFLLGGDTPAVRNTVNVALCQMPGSLYLPVKTGDTARNTYAAHAAAQSIHLAQATLAGVTAPADVGTEVQHIIMAEDRSKPAEWTVHETLLIEDAYIKMFAAVRHVHYGVTCALDWVKNNGTQATPAVEELSLSIYEEAVTYCGVRQPRTAIQAQFSLSYGIAHALAFGSLGPEAYGPGRLTHPEVQRLEALINIIADPAMTNRGAVLNMVIAGQTEAHTVDALVGDPGSPLGDNDFTGKAKAYMTPVVGDDKAVQMIESVLDTSANDVLRLTT